MVAVGEPLEIKLQEHDYFVWTDKNQLQQYPVTDSVIQILDSFFLNIWFIPILGSFGVFEI